MGCRRPLFHDAGQSKENYVGTHSSLSMDTPGNNKVAPSGTHDSDMVDVSGRTTGASSSSDVVQAASAGFWTPTPNNRQDGITDPLDTVTQQTRVMDSQLSRDQASNRCLFSSPGTVDALPVDSPEVVLRETHVCRLNKQTMGCQRLLFHERAEFGEGCQEAFSGKEPMHGAMDAQMAALPVSASSSYTLDTGWSKGAAPETQDSISVDG